MFEYLKHLLSSLPVLQLPDFEDPNALFVVSTDASGYVLGAVLEQRVETDRLLFTPSHFG